jgi:outer membrane protein assembly factor BamA
MVLDTEATARPRMGTAALALVLLGGCSRIPQGHAAIDDVTVRGASKIDAAEVLDKIATAESPKFLGVFRGLVYDYAIFDRVELQRDLARVERLYRSRGYYSAHARAGRFMATSQNHVRVEILVEEGQPVLNDDLRIDGLEGLPAPLSALVRRAARDALPRGKPFTEDHFKDAGNAVKRALTDRGYAYAQVKREVYLDIVKNQAEVVFSVHPDTPATFGEVTFARLDPASAGKPVGVSIGPVLRAIDIKKGAPYSTAVLDAATSAVLDLQVFAAVELSPDLPDPPPADHVVPITVKVDPARLRQVRLGGGVEFDEIKTDLHLLLGWEDHDFLGGLRDLSVELRPGAVLYPLRVNNLVAPNRALPEERLRLRFKEPGFIESRLNAFITPELNIYPLLVKTNPAPDDPVVGYRELKVAVGVDRTLWKLFGSVSYNLQVENPFSYVGPLDPALRTLVLSYPDLLTQFDFRDDRVHPRSGLYLANDLQVAGGPFGGTATDVKIQPEVRGYLPVSKRFTLAARTALGFLFPFNYGSVVENQLAQPLTDANRDARVQDIETVFFRGLFSGGPNSNRGFPIRGIAPHGVVPFLNPATASQQVALSCDPSPANNFSPDPTTCSIPIGGFTLWELSVELRAKVVGDFSGAVFCDSGDVSPHTADLRFTHLHLSCGLGARYDTPVGPIRLDVGYRIQPLQVIGFASEDAVVKADPTEGVQPKLLGVPIAIAFGIGEAF